MLNRHTPKLKLHFLTRHTEFRLKILGISLLALQPWKSLKIANIMTKMEEPPHHVGIFLTWSSSDKKIPCKKMKKMISYIHLI